MTEFQFFICTYVHEIKVLYDSIIGEVTLVKILLHMVGRSWKSTSFSVTQFLNVPQYGNAYCKKSLKDNLHQGFVK